MQRQDETRVLLERSANAGEIGARWADVQERRVVPLEEYLGVEEFDARPHVVPAGEQVARFLRETSLARFVVRTQDAKQFATQTGAALPGEAHDLTDSRAVRPANDDTRATPQGQRLRGLEPTDVAEQAVTDEVFPMLHDNHARGSDAPAADGSSRPRNSSM